MLARENPHIHLVQRRVPALTGLLTGGSFLVVAAVILGAVPSTLLPRAPAPVMGLIPHAIAAVSVVAVGTITAAVVATGRERVRRHRTLMLAALALFGLFLTVDFYRLTVVGPTPFAGPAVVETDVYLPLLAVDVAAALRTFPAVYYALLVGLTTPTPERPATRHRRAGRLATSLWLTAFGTGLGIYVMVHLVW